MHGCGMRGGRGGEVVMGNVTVAIMVVRLASRASTRKGGVAVGCVVILQSMEGV